jgi:hypothetical protein
MDTIAQTEIEAARQKGREAVANGEEGVGFEYDWRGPLATAYAEGFREENKKWTEASLIGAAKPDRIVAVIPLAPDCCPAPEGFRSHTLEIVFRIAESAGWTGRLVQACVKCTGVSRRTPIWMAGELVNFLGIALQDLTTHMANAVKAAQDDLDKDFDESKLTDPYYVEEMRTAYEALTPAQVEEAVRQLARMAEEGEFGLLYPHDKWQLPRMH